jgi:hypothetical protein
MASFHNISGFQYISDSRIYPAANECIYCGARGVNLTDEHTLPDGLGGRHVLPQASCGPCQKLINEEIEQYCLRTLLAQLRALHGIKSRKKRPSPPLSVRVRRHTGAIERINLDVADLPRVFALPVFPEPRFLTSEPVTETYDGWWWHYEDPQFGEWLKTHNAAAIISETIKPDKLARLVAKIAHAHAWALWGGQFEPFLLPLIMGKEKNYTRLIGGWGQILEPTPDLNHTFNFMKCRGEDGDEESYLIASMRFFSGLNGPVYYAVIGRLLAPWPLQERTASTERQ